MATVVLDVSPEVLEHAKERAASQNTTVERVLEESLANFAEGHVVEERKGARLLALLDKGLYHLNSAPLTREETYAERTWPRS
jgi:hypothetical protein